MTTRIERISYLVLPDASAQAAAHRLNPELRAHIDEGSLSYVFVRLSASLTGPTSAQTIYTGGITGLPLWRIPSEVDFSEERIGAAMALEQESLFATLREMGYTAGQIALAPVVKEWEVA